jgi:hypothetical protein
MIRKRDLQNGMIVKSSDGRYGVVCLQDATDKNCIKFFYDPQLTIAHGSVVRSNCGDFVVPLDCFTDDMKYICSEEDAKVLGFTTSGNTVTLWSIVDVFSLRQEFTRPRCSSSCRDLHICKVSYGDEIVGYCMREQAAFVGTIEEIHDGAAICISDDKSDAERDDDFTIYQPTNTNSTPSVSGDTKKIGTPTINSDTKRFCQDDLFSTRKFQIE